LHFIAQNAVGGPLLQSGRGSLSSNGAWDLGLLPVVLVGFPIALLLGAQASVAAAEGPVGAMLVGVGIGVQILQALSSSAAGVLIRAPPGQASGCCRRCYSAPWPSWRRLRSHSLRPTLLCSPRSGHAPHALTQNALGAPGWLGASHCEVAHAGAERAARPQAHFNNSTVLKLLLTSALDAIMTNSLLGAALAAASGDLQGTLASATGFKLRSAEIEGSRLVPPAPPALPRRPGRDAR